MPNTIVVAARLDADVYTQIVTPSGTIFPHGSASIPTGHLLCDGSAVSRTTYADLFTAIGTIWGVGDGSTTFNVPDLRGRTLFGKAASGTFVTLGSTGGSETNTHTASHNHFTPSGHTHSFANHTHVIAVGGSHFHDQGAIVGGSPTRFQGGGNITSSNGSHSHGGATSSAGAGTTDAGFLITSSVSPTINSSSMVNPYVVAQYVIKV